MYITNPTYLNGDNISLKDYFSSHLKDSNRLYFSSVREMLKITAKYTGGLLLLTSFAIFLLLIILSLRDGKGINWILCIFFPAFFFALFFPFTLIGSYYYYIHCPRKDSGRIRSFITSCFPAPVSVTELAPNHVLVQCDGLEYELAYTRMNISPEGSPKLNYQRTYIVSAYFAHPGEAPTDEYLDEFFNNWNSYQQGKEACSNLMMDKNSIDAFYFEKQGLNPEIIKKSIAEIKYIISRYNLIPLHVKKTE
ncbi:hypothetical protein [uncultured Muribaculum sp.]|uniref:hypothetical protein n=2 Tax=uncultured Muribaculum sp. TaxID=1918613 RepID=UPI0026330651|nr:hypothetical protein [uncultured Muribaculum sp.]